MKEKYDIVIIGSGLGGLVSANILARHDYSVCVLEKNNQFGGNLQIFVRDKKIFDTGVHYVGSLGKGENLYQYFKYLGIMDDLKIQKLDQDKYDVITFDLLDKEFYHAQGYENFAQSLLKQFPKEEKAIQNYCQKVKDACNSFPLYNLDGETNGYNKSFLTLKISDFLDSITQNDLLKAVLAGSNFLYAGEKNTPFYVHALSVNSYIKSAWRCIGGGGQIASLLVKKLKENGGEIFNYQEVVKLNFKKEELVSVTTKSGQEVKANIFISNLEPKRTIEMLEGKGLRKSYVNRINQIKSGISAFSLYIVLKPQCFPYLNYNYYHFKDPENIWDVQNYVDTNWPKGYMISVGVKDEQNEWADSLTAMTYMKFEEVSQWKDTFNTIAEESDRGLAYKKFKERKAKVFIDELEKKFPEIRKCIQSVHTSTPLSYRDYIGSNNGAMYGYKKDADNPMRSILSPKTRVENFFFTGQSMNMHGVLGVTIGAVLTCSQIIGKEKLLQSINSALAKDEK